MKYFLCQPCTGIMDEAYTLEVQKGAEFRKTCALCGKSTFCRLYEVKKKVKNG